MLTFRLKSVLLEKYGQSGWQMLIIQPCVGVRVFSFDPAMSLLQSYLGATPQANRGQTLRVTVTFKKKPLTDNIFATISKFSSWFSAKPSTDKDLCVPVVGLCNSFPKNVKDRTNTQASVNCASNRWRAWLHLTAPSSKHAHLQRISVHPGHLNFMALLC